MKKIIIGSTILTLIMTTLVSAQEGCYGGMWSMMSGSSGYGFGMMSLGWLTYLLVIGLIIAAIYWLIQSAKHKK